MCIATMAYVYMQRAKYVLPSLVLSANSDRSQILWGCNCMLLLKPPILVCCWCVYIDDKLLHTIVAYPALPLKILAAKSNILNLLKANRKISRTTD